jgi:hypothetical protein
LFSAAAIRNIRVIRGSLHRFNDPTFFATPSKIFGSKGATAGNEFSLGEIIEGQNK